MCFFMYLGATFELFVLCSSLVSTELLPRPYDVTISLVSTCYTNRCKKNTI
jgi:hypothetical protein